MPHRYHIYNFQDEARAAAAREKMAAMERDGWDIHTAAPGYSELCILWVKKRDEPAAQEPDPQQDASRWRDALFDIAGSVPFDLDELLAKHGLSRESEDVPAE